MKTLYYALASSRYHKKFSIAYGLFFGLFLFLFTLLLNLKKMVLLLHTQVSSRIALIDAQLNENSASVPLDNHQVTQVSQVYQSLLYCFLGIFLFITILALSFFFRYKKKEILQWRLVGLKFREILRLLVVESLLPAITVTFVVAAFLFVCQNTYESLLQTINLRVLHWLNVNDYTVLTQTTESHSFMIGLPFDQVTLFQVDFNDRFWFSDVFLAILKVFSAMALLTSIIISLLSTGFIKHWTKKGRWSM
ncbi:hypothetical protein RV11_GL001558 [Enterococcus phoeniculicola]|jgi:hypothetical protein|uniref:ABC3 transporter permease protein domain-containing protein n=1 Tax=Enterococcus phoeniculicola ATCC BAA-412 TaxID=1158610 RepID=R3W371_9ENTE|nr:hypothetical protein [Enterococcus phoeniculicola]EOL41896.1 hypothetical protein UC3_02244 [Enterococcus phoeniculicola ATCC BAA-412]EOT79825.1 hypothetical protein I589_01337 [Enterococcus phoeniculicola ATCC BAA-412]OJG70285.1 hypothetical protein RV11_GL001558 [Enterococcus phoeniculicola]